MPGKLPKTIWVYRILHYKNSEYTLRNGIYTRDSPKADPNYINIGDSGLIEQRNDFPVPIPPSGNLGDYVPFYFGTHSPMLLNIKTGYRGVTKRPERDIIYFCCDVRSLMNHCAEWVFTDGHAKNSITEFFNTPGDLKEVDWDIVRERYWSNNEDDFDRMRRKQAEFLVKNHVPQRCIGQIVVFDDDM